MMYDKLQLKLKIKRSVAGGVQRQRRKGKTLLFPMLKLKHLGFYTVNHARISTVPQRTIFLSDVKIEL